jgi:hypothetical protein
MKKLIAISLLAASSAFANPWLICTPVTSGLSNSPVTYTVSGLPNSPITSNAVTITSGTVQLDLDLGAAGQNVPYGSYTVSTTASNTNGTSGSSSNLTLNVPAIATPSTSSLTSTTVTLNSNLTQDGGTAATTEGFYYGPTTSYGTTASSTGSFTSGAFSQNLTGLTAGTLYHYQAFATNGNCGVYGPDETFTTSSGPAFVQGANVVGTATAVSSVSLAYGSNEGSGDVNAVCVYWYKASSPPTISSVTDTKGNSYTLAKSELNYNTGNNVAVYYATGIASGANTVTVNFSASTATYASIMEVEYSGMGSFDASSGATGSSGTSLSSGNLTTTVSSDELIGFQVGNSAFTVGSGYTQRISSGSGNWVTEDDTAGAAGSYSATSTQASSGGWASICIAFQP